VFSEFRGLKIIPFLCGSQCPIMPIVMKKRKVSFGFGYAALSPFDELFNP
jgi:hypothetical protein